VGGKVLLYSGGMDSWLINKLWNPEIKLYIDSGSSYAKEEIKRLPKNVEVVKLDLSPWEREDKIIPLRNLYFISVAANYGDEICLGATAGDRVLDKSYGFASKAGDLLTYLYQEQHWTEKREITVNLDYKQYSKTDLVFLYKAAGGDLEQAWDESFSCYHPTQEGKECWECKPCYRKFIAFWRNGYLPPMSVINKWYTFVRKNHQELQKELLGRGNELEEFIVTLEEVQKLNDR